MSDQRKLLTATCLVVLSVMASVVHAADNGIGKVLLSRGEPAAQASGLPPRLLKDDDPVFQNDRIVTPEDGFAVIELSDGTKITVLSGSRLDITRYQFNNGKSKAEYDLVSGGIRVAADAESAESGVYPIKIRTRYAYFLAGKASFDVRLCDEQCRQERMEQQQLNAKLVSREAARVMELEGEVLVTGLDGETGELYQGGPVYPGDKLSLQGNAQARLVFRDDTRMILKDGAELVLDEFAWGKEEDSLFKARLLKGDIQLRPGEIAKNDADAFLVDTPRGRIDANAATFPAKTLEVDLVELFESKEYSLDLPGVYATVYNGKVIASWPYRKRKEQVTSWLLELMLPTATAQGDEAGRAYVELIKGESLFVDEHAMYQMPTPPRFLTEECQPHPDELGRQVLWPPVFLKGDACAAVYSFYSGFANPLGGPLEEPGFEQPSRPVPPEQPTPPTPPAPPPPVSGRI